jgi:hypothetical protein
MPLMPESITQSEMDHTNDAVVKIAPVSNTQILKNSTQLSETFSEQSLATSPKPVIWTPRFIIIFALALIIGLSVASLLTQGMLNGYYPPQAVLLVLVALALGGWIAVARLVRSLWTRMGGIFGSIWAVFTGISLVISLLPIDPGSPILLHLSASTNSALLGSYICLSIDRTPFYRWDSWFFRLAPILGGCAVAATYFLFPADPPSFINLESATVTVILILCVLIWWTRPSCWRSQPGLAFLFGTTPFILLLLTLLNVTDKEGHLFFLTQVALLSLLLGILRVLQGEIQNR